MIDLRPPASIDIKKSMENLLQDMSNCQYEPAVIVHNGEIHTSMASVIASEEA